MSSFTVSQCLPVPYISETVFQHQPRKPHSFCLKPPKLQPKHDISLNRTLNNTSLTPHVISFRDDNKSLNNSFCSDTDSNCTNGYQNSLLYNSVYDRDSRESYFDQCFETIEKIGEGSFGEVFKVRSKEDGLLYAVKKSKKLFRSKHEREERLKEVKRYEQFSGYEHCIQFHKAWEQDDRLYMQMELCRENLEQYLSQRCHIPEKKIWPILLDLLLALKGLHDRNLIHLDIKLDNILISEDDSCKLGDFGLVVDLDEANKYQTEGDSRYVASEVMLGQFSKAADIFSLGITILEFSCNLQLPPNGPLWQELRMGILPSQFIAKISPELRDVIKTMMDPDPNKRPTVDQLLSHKKMVELQQERRRWNLFRKIKSTCRRANLYIWTKMCNFRNVIHHFIISIIAVVKSNEKQIINNNINNYNNNNINNNNNNDININDDDIFLDNELKEHDLSITTPSAITNEMQFHSTPLNHNSISLRRSKKYTSRMKHSSNILNSSELNSNEQDWNSDLDLDKSAPSLICKQLFVSDESD